MPRNDFHSPLNALMLKSVKYVRVNIDFCCLELLNGFKLCYASVFLKIVKTLKSSAGTNGPL